MAKLPRIPIKLAKGFVKESKNRGVDINQVVVYARNRDTGNRAYCDLWKAC